MSKIKTREEIKDIVENLKKQNKTIVTTNGTFDIIHTGHVKSFTEARNYGDLLIVGLNSDSSVKAYKSPSRPFNDQQERAELLAALECVDYVTIFDELTPNELLKVIKPHYHIKAKAAFTSFGGPEKEIVEGNGGKIILIDTVEGKSTTSLVKKIIEVHKNEVDATRRRSQNLEIGK
jgi:rfaE bifunctional protein nucleotidyltransferase chain/domain